MCQSSLLPMLTPFTLCPERASGGAPDDSGVDEEKTEKGGNQAACHSGVT